MIAFTVGVNVKGGVSYRHHDHFTTATPYDGFTRYGTLPLLLLSPAGVAGVIVAAGNASK